MTLIFEDFYFNVKKISFTSSSETDFTEYGHPVQLWKTTISPKNMEFKHIKVAEHLQILDLFKKLFFIFSQNMLWKPVNTCFLNLENSSSQRFFSDFQTFGQKVKKWKKSITCPKMTPTRQFLVYMSGPVVWISIQFFFEWVDVFGALWKIWGAVRLFFFIHRKCR